MKLNDKIKTLLAVSGLLVFLQASAEDYYWVGGSGNWSDINNWATESGGSVLHYRVPEADDNVFFDQNSFNSPNGVVVINLGNAVCRDMDWTGAKFNPVLTSQDSINLRIYGSLILVPGMTFNYRGTVWFESVEPGRVIDMAGHPFLNHATFQGIGGGWSLESNVACNLDIFFKNGNINTLGHSISCQRFVSDLPNQRGLRINGSTIIVNEWIVNGTNFTLLSQGSLITCYSTVNNFSGSVLRYWDIYFPSTGNLSQTDIYCRFRNVIFGLVGSVNGNCTIDSLTFNSEGLVNGNDSISKLYAMRFAKIQGASVIGKAIFFNNGNFDGINQFDTLYLTAGNSYEFGIFSTQTIVRELNIQGNCFAPIRMHSSYIGVPAYIRKTNGTVQGAYLSLRDLHAGGNVPFYASHSVDLGNNVNWNIETAAPRNLYWVNGGGNWEDPAHWDIISGGSGGQCPPTEIDNVFFNAGSFQDPSQAVLIRIKNAVCHDMSWSGVTNNPALAGADTCNIRIFGSLELNPGMNVTLTGDFYFESKDKNETIKTCGRIINRHFIFTGKYGGWSLLDSLTVVNTIFLQRGDLYTRGNAVRCFAFSSEDTTTRKLFLSTSTFSIEGSWRLNGEHLVLRADSSLIKALNDGSYVYTFNGYRHKYHDVELQGNGSYIQNDAYCLFNLVTAFKKDCYVSRDCTIDSVLFYGFNSHLYDHDTVNYVIFNERNGFVQGTHIIHECVFMKDGFIYGSNSFDILKFSPTSTYYLEYNQQQTIHERLDAIGLCTGPINIKSDHNFARATIYKTNGTITGEYLTLRNLIASGPGIPFTAVNSIDLGNNVNWNFIEPNSKNLFWVQGTGNWNDSLHWAAYSGGPGGHCIPTSQDDVFFDQNSFDHTSDSVIINITDAVCHDMDWSEATRVPNFYGADTFNVRIYGSLQLLPTMNWIFLGRTYFESDHLNNEIRSAGNSFKGEVIFKGVGGGWTLMDDMSVNTIIRLQNGSLITGDNKVTCDVFESNYDSDRELNISSSIFQLGEWHIQGDKLNFQTDSRSLIISSRSVNTTNGNPLFYNDIEFHGSPSLNSSNARVFFNNVIFLGTTIEQGSVNGNCFIDSLRFDVKGFVNGSDTINYAIFNRYADVNGTNYIHQCYLEEDGRLTGINRFDTLKLTPGSTYELQEGQQQEVLEYFKVRGNNCFPIVLRSQRQGIQASIYSPAGMVVSGDFLDLRDMNATGGAEFYAGLHSTDISNNSGWIFTNSPGYIYGFTADTTLCMDQVYFISTENFNPESNTTFEWHDGSTLPYFVSTTDDTVSIKVHYADDCTYNDTLFIQRLPLPKLDLPSELHFCDTDTVFMPPQEIPVTYLWQDGSTDTSYVIYAEGLYWVTATSDSGCSVTDSVYVRVFPSPQVYLGDEITVKWGESIQLDAGNPGASYLWSTGETTQKIMIGGEQTVWVDVEKDGCISSDTVIIHEFPRCLAEVPAAFSPNSDGQNDILYVYGDGFESFELLIFNRFGELVFKTNDQGTGWDGSYQGKPQEMEVYNYILKGVCIDGGSFFKKGNITLLR